MVEIKNYGLHDKEGKSSGNMTIASGPVIIEEEKVLLIKDKKDDFWKFPGGTQHDNESWIQTCEREAGEELGLKIKIQSEPYAILMEKPNETGEKKVVLLIHYLAQRLSDIVKGEDILEYDFKDINNLPDDVGANIKPTVEHFRKLQ